MLKNYTAWERKPTGKLMISYEMEINIKCSEHTQKVTK